MSGGPTVARPPCSRRPALLAGLAALAAGAGCVSATSAYREHVNALVEQDQYAAALQAVEEQRVPKYGERDRVLYWLDKGALLHMSRDYRDSDALLDQAELRIDELYTKSLTQAAGTVLVNDATQDYAGEPHERALLYVLRALNYAFAGKADEAVVEARKVTAFLQLSGERVGMKAYRDDAFAHYLSAMLFEDAGRLDDARISRDAAERAYAGYAAAFRTPAPQFGLPTRGARDGELVVVQYAGKVPIRGSKTTSVPVGRKLTVREMMQTNADEQQASIPVAIPTIVMQPWRGRSATVTVDGRSSPTVRVEPISEITIKALEDEMPAIKARAAARAAAKGAGYGALQGAAPRVLSGAALSAMGASEQADTRSWFTLPAEIRMARVVVPAGVHDVVVTTADAQGATVETRTLHGVRISAGYRTWVHVRTAR